MAELEKSSSHPQQANKPKDETGAPQKEPVQAPTFDAAKEVQAVAAQDVIQQKAQTNPEAKVKNTDTTGQADGTVEKDEKAEQENPFEEVDLNIDHDDEQPAREQSQETPPQGKTSEEPAKTTPETQTENPQPQVKPEEAKAPDESEKEDEPEEMYLATDKTSANSEAEDDDESNENQPAQAAPDTTKLNAVLDTILAKRADPQQIKADVEAVLFITSKALQVNEIAEIVEAEAEEIENALGELIQDYAFREGCGLEIDDTDGYILQVREDCARIVHKMMPLEMSAATLRTLSAIAIKSPIVQSDLIELRGSTAYDHISELLSKKLISKRRQGRSYVLNTTKAFDDYFKLKGNKRELEVLVNRLKPENKQNTSASPQQEEPDAFEEQVTA